MLKIAHLLTGAAALVLALFPLLRGAEGALLFDANGVALSLMGLIQLLLACAGSAQQGLRQQLQPAVLLLAFLAVLLQALAVTGQLATLAGQPTLLSSLLLMILATFLHLGINLALPRRQAGTGHRASPGAPRSGASDSGRETGTVKWFNTSKGFGFISRDSGEDIFVHFRAIRGEGHRVLIEGQRVEFSVMQRDKGLQAEDVIAAAPARR